MNTQLIEHHWNGIGEQRHDLVETFYRRLFERHPRFRPRFPSSFDYRMEKMVDTLALIAKESDARRLIQPRLAKLGAKHRDRDLSSQDFEDFIVVLVEVIGEYNAAEWTPACADSWREALHRVVVPLMMAEMTGT